MSAVPNVLQLVVALTAVFVAWYAWDTRHLLRYHLDGQPNTCPKAHHHVEGWP